MSQPMQLLDSPPDDTLIKDSFKNVRDGLAQVPEGKTGALVIATDWKWGFVPTFTAGTAFRIAGGWEVRGEGFLSKASKGASVKAVKTWVLLFCLFLASPALAQVVTQGPITATHKFAWEAPANVTTVTEGQSFEPRINDGPTPITALTGVTCAPAVAPATGITCQAPVGASNRDALNRVGSHSLTLVLFRADVGSSPASAPFSLLSPAGAPTALRLIP